MASKPHVHRQACLETTSWQNRCPGLSHQEWVALAGGHPDQNCVWQSHEYHARRNGRFHAESAELGWLDHGGEG